ncbi:MAG: S1/P1 nuclease [Gammaproteobacteria bacterium]|nr:S1/P1 nuclease [Gammaproteobacteria bacterium]NNJ71576.1 S1/P1 Nuclease [Enterobacterales bacterium]
MKLRFLLIFLAIAIPTITIGFGQTGHRVTGLLAERYLSDVAKQEIAKLLGNQTLAEISTYCDEQKANPSEFWQKTADPWHYMTVPDGKTYTNDMAPPQGDAITALAMFTKQLQDTKVDKETRALALKFIVHIIGDLHQPLHVGNGKDRGGNNVKVEFFRERSNLHRVWDSGMINAEQLSYTEWTNWLGRKISTEDVASWSSIDPLVWAKESQNIRMSIYPENERLSWDYKYQNIDTVKLRLSQAGVRIAYYLNAVFANAER